jgi:HD-GYP domain-containing protein (c-di-GMP phosphodiesterase class II)
LNENASKTTCAVFRKGDLQIEPPDEARIYDETIEGWAHALELRDKESHGHSHRVTSMTISLAHLMGIDDREMVNVRRGALLHDIGKIAIPDNILFKPGKLTRDEWEIMKKHPVYAYELLFPITYLKQTIDIPYCHHERWDGSGYPRGLKGEEIPLTARIFSLVDVWDALGTDRCYRPAWSAQEIRKYLSEQAGIQFDPTITTIFLEYLEELEQKGTQLLTEMNQQAHFLTINNPVI